jgi:hypothetical protein
VRNNPSITARIKKMVRGIPIHDGNIPKAKPGPHITPPDDNFGVWRTRWTSTLIRDELNEHGTENRL